MDNFQLLRQERHLQKRKAYLASMEQDQLKIFEKINKKLPEAKKQKWLQVLEEALTQEDINLALLQEELNLLLQKILAETKNIAEQLEAEHQGISPNLKELEHSENEEQTEVELHEQASFTSKIEKILDNNKIENNNKIAAKDKTKTLWY